MSIYPKIKNTIPFFVLDQEVQIGEEYGVACFIEDPTGCVALLVRNLTGEHTMEQICNIVQAQYPDVSNEEILTAIEVLDERGFLENAIHNDHGLTPYLTERYKANLNYFSLFTRLSENKFSIQEKINHTKIALLGIGGLGSQILYHLSAVGFHNVKALDFDILELSNFNRQLLYSEADLGQPKTELAKKRIAQFNPNVDLQITNKKVASPQDVIDHIQNTDFVICVADKPTMYILPWVNEAVVKLGIPLITGGILNTRGRFFSIIPGQTGCLHCAKEADDQQNPKHKQQMEYMFANNHTRQNATISPNVGILAGIMVNEIVKFITGIASPSSMSKVSEINFIEDYKISEISAWEKRESCSVCGTPTPILPQ